MDNVLNIPAEDFLKTAQNMATFQMVHNELRKDFQMIYELAKTKFEDSDLIKPLIRSCYKEMFSLIEADMHLLNQFNSYPGYIDRHTFIVKFKKTFKHHAKTFNKEELNYKFNSLNFSLLTEQKEIRDAVTHPKQRESIDVDASKLEILYTLYQRYNDFISELMTNIGISTKIKSIRDILPT